MGSAVGVYQGVVIDWSRVLDALENGRHVHLEAGQPVTDFFHLSARHRVALRLCLNQSRGLLLSLVRRGEEGRAEELRHHVQEARRTIDMLPVAIEDGTGQPPQELLLRSLGDAQRAGRLAWEFGCPSMMEMLVRGRVLRRVASHAAYSDDGHLWFAAVALAEETGMYMAAIREGQGGGDARK